MQHVLAFFNIQKGCCCCCCRDACTLIPTRLSWHIISHCTSLMCVSACECVCAWGERGLVVGKWSLSYFNPGCCCNVHAPSLHTRIHIPSPSLFTTYLHRCTSPSHVTLPRPYKAVTAAVSAMHMYYRKKTRYTQRFFTLRRDAARHWTKNVRVNFLLSQFFSFFSFKVDKKYSN